FAHPVPPPPQAYSLPLHDALPIYRRLMTDADLSTPIEELDRLMARMEEGYDVVIASRALPGSNVEVRQGRTRESMGRLFNLCVRSEEHTSELQSLAYLVCRPLLEK